MGLSPLRRLFLREEGDPLRKELNRQVVRWLKERAAGPFAGDLSLVAAYGSHFNGTETEYSDVDCYFIPKSDRGWEFAADFLLAGVGYDVFPLSWERARGIAQLKEPLVPLVGDAVVLYAGSPEDASRFQALHEELARCLKDRAYCCAMSWERFQEAARHLAQLRAQEALVPSRVQAGQLLMAAAEAVALQNGTYFHYGLKRQFQDLQAMEQKPAGFLEGYTAVVQAETVGELRAACQCLMASLGEALGWQWDIPAVEPPAVPQPKKEEVGELAPWYEEISATFQKLRSCRERNDPVLAFLSAVCLQRELDGAGEEYSIPRYPLLDAYHFSDLTPLVQAADRVEQELVERIEQGGGRIKRFGSVEELALFYP